MYTQTSALTQCSRAYLQQENPRNFAEVLPF